MAKQYTHRFRQSWWDGKATSLCGITCESGELTESWFSGDWNVDCPQCRRKLKK